MNDKCDEAFVGTDVAKAWLDVAALRSPVVRLEHTPEGVAALVQRLRQTLPTLVVSEVTGKLETDAATASREAVARGGAVGRAVRAARVAVVDAALATTG